MRIREATEADIPAIVAFTTRTFEWGDYVPRLIHEWISAGDSIVLVAEEDGEPIALGRARLQSSKEVWMHGARVHPDHRGRGIAGRATEVLLDWSRSQGASIARLLIEDTNESSIRQIQKMGFRRSTSPVRASLEMTDQPDPLGNGGSRQRSTLKAAPGRTSDAVMIATSWPVSKCGHGLRGLVAEGWSFRTLTVGDVEDAAKAQGLWEIGPSVAIVHADEERFEVRMLDTDEMSAPETIRSLIDLAERHRSAAVSIWLADIDWLTEAASEAGCTLSRFGIWVKSL